MNHVEHVQSRPNGFWNNPHHGLVCMNDTEPFIGPIYSYPIRTNNGKWLVNGVFCSLACTKRYLMDNIKQFDCFTLFTHMCAVVYQHPGNIPPAPDRFQLTKFTGPGKGISIQEYRSKLPTTSVCISPPFHYQDQCKLDLYPVPLPETKDDTEKPESDTSLEIEPGTPPLSPADSKINKIPMDVTMVYPTSQLSTLGNFLKHPPNK